MSETIKATPELYYSQSSIRAVDADLAKGATAPSNDTVIPAGWPVVAKGDGKYEIFTKAALAEQITGKAGTQGTSVTVLPKAIGILLEPVKVASSGMKGRVAYAGDFDLSNIRAITEIATTDIADYVFLDAKGHIVFTVRDNVAVFA